MMRTAPSAASGVAGPRPTSRKPESPSVALCSLPVALLTVTTQAVQLPCTPSLSTWRAAVVSTAQDKWCVVKWQVVCCVVLFCAGTEALCNAGAHACDVLQQLTFVDITAASRDHVLACFHQRACHSAAVYAQFLPHIDAVGDAHTKNRPANQAGRQAGGRASGEQQTAFRGVALINSSTSSSSSSSGGGAASTHGPHA
jgi:hypothetical protein